MSNLKKFVIALLLLVVLIPAGAFGYIYFKLNSMYDSSSDTKTLTKTDYKAEKGITNILLVGTDGRTLEEASRSDSMMILTIDNKHKSVKLTSLARDTYVNIPGHGEQKLTHAYAYGGPALLLQTIDKNFGLKIDKYAAVSFSSFEKIIDALGGVEIDVLPKEVSYIQGVDSAGKQTLNGAEALAYSRIRYADDAYQRDNRQRTVMQAAYNKLSSNPGDLMEIGNTILGYTKTNIPPMEIFKLANKVIKMNFTEFPQLEFPLDGHREGKTLSQEKGWVILWDKEYNNEQLKKFIFDYKNYTQQ